MCADFLSYWLSSHVYAAFHLGLSPIGRVKKKKTHLSPQLDQIASSIKSIGATILLSSHINSPPSILYSTDYIDKSALPKDDVGTLD